MSKLSMLTPNLQKNAKEPLYRQLYLYIKEEIERGSLPNGMGLPSIRSLADYLSVSRNTVDLAYQELLGEGYIYSVKGSGFYVNGTQDQVEHDTHRNKQNTNPPTSKNTYDFIHFPIDYQHFPYQVWDNISRLVPFHKSIGSHFQTDSQGDIELRKEVANYLFLARGIKCSPEQIVIGANFTQLLQTILLIIKKEANPIVYFEDPSYDKARKLFIHHDYQLHPLPIEFDGIDLKELTKHRRGQFLYTAPSHQVPLGVEMSLEKRTTLLQWAAENNIYILEDDYYSVYKYKGQTLPSLQSLDTNEKVIYFSGFDKLLCPEILCSFMVLPPQLLEKYKSTIWTFSTPLLPSHLQKQLSIFLTEGYFYKHLKKMKRLYAQKTQFIVELIEKHLAAHIRIANQNSGTHLIIEFKNRAIEDEEEITNFLFQSGILMKSTKQFWYQYQPKHPQFILHYGGLQKKYMEEAILQLKKEFG
ncbi:MocR-like pyridoxine biosynthesis transcription factor PdxR [Pseudoneobacillus sp. C159]